MNHIKRMDTEYRKTRFRQILAEKCISFTSHQIEMILEHINFRRLYLIKVTKTSKKFLNITTSESIYGPDKKMLSIIIPIFGCFTPGSFTHINGNRDYVPGEISDNSACAAVKMSVFTHEEKLRHTYTLVIYDPS